MFHLEILFIFNWPVSTWPVMYFEMRPCNFNANVIIKIAKHSWPKSIARKRLLCWIYLHLMTQLGLLLLTLIRLFFQIIRGEEYNASVDWFSFGVVLYEMHVGRLPFSAADEDEMFKCILHQQPKFPKHMKSDAVSCIKAVRCSLSFMFMLKLKLAFLSFKGTSNRLMLTIHWGFIIGFSYGFLCGCLGLAVG